MDSEIANILVSEYPVVLPYSGFWLNALTIARGCVLLGNLMIASQSHQKFIPMFSFIQLAGFCLLMLLGLCFGASLPFPRTTLKSGLPLWGILITFLVFAAFTFLCFRKLDLIEKLLRTVFAITVPMLSCMLAIASLWLLSLPSFVLWLILLLFFSFLQRVTFAVHKTRAMCTVIEQKK